MPRSRALDEAFARATCTEGLLTKRALRRAGVSEAALVRAMRAGRVVRVRRGVYAQVPAMPRPAWLVTEHGLDQWHQSAVRALLLSLPRAAAAGRTAALLRGWELLVEPRKHELALRHGTFLRPCPRDVLARQVRHPRFLDVVPVLGGAPVSLLEAHDVVLGALLRLAPLEAVVLADSALRAGDVTIHELRDRATALPGRQQAAHARRLLDWCDDGAGSVLESVMRYRMLEAGIDGFVTQRVIRRRGRHVLRADFCFEAERLVVEVDGERWHPDPARDRRKDNALVAAGWRVLRFTWSEVLRDHHEVLAMVREALLAVRSAA